MHAVCQQACVGVPQRLCVFDSYLPMIATFEWERKNGVTNSKTEQEKDRKIESKIQKRGFANSITKRDLCAWRLRENLPRMPSPVDLGKTIPVPHFLREINISVKNATAQFIKVACSMQARRKRTTETWNTHRFMTLLSWEKKKRGEPGAYFYENSDETRVWTSDKKSEKWDQALCFSKLLSSTWTKAVLYSYRWRFWGFLRKKSWTIRRYSYLWKIRKISTCRYTIPPWFLWIITI